MVIVILQFLVAGILVARGFRVWGVNPVVSVTELIPFEKIPFPAITICANTTPDEFQLMAMALNQVRLQGCNDTKVVSTLLPLLFGVIFFNL